MEKVLIVRGDEVTALYSDELRELGGTLRVHRASDVEWDDAAQGWVATIRTGPTRLGPYATREDALAAEVEFLQARL
jgi:hypothetical protein